MVSSKVHCSTLTAVWRGGNLHQLNAVRLAAMGGCCQQGSGHLFVTDTAEQRERTLMKDPPCDRQNLFKDHFGETRHGILSHMKLI